MLCCSADKPEWCFRALDLCARYGGDDDDDHDDDDDASNGNEQKDSDDDDDDYLITLREHCAWTAILSEGSSPDKFHPHQLDSSLEPGGHGSWVCGELWHWSPTCNKADTGCQAEISHDQGPQLVFETCL